MTPTSESTTTASKPHSAPRWPLLMVLSLIYALRAWDLGVQSLWYELVPFRYWRGNISLNGHARYNTP